MALKEANAILELFASKSQQYRYAIRVLVAHPVLAAVKALFVFITQRFQQKMFMSGMTLEELTRREGDRIYSLNAPVLIEKVFQKLKKDEKQQILEGLLDNLDEETRQEFLKKHSAS